MMCKEYKIIFDIYLHSRPSAELMDLDIPFNDHFEPSVTDFDTQYLLSWLGVVQ